MDMTYSGSQTTDQTLTEARAAAPGQPIRLRLQPQLFIKGRGYQAWRLVSWAVRCQTAGEVKELRRALEAFFTRIERDGPAAVGEELRGKAPSADAPVRHDGFSRDENTPLGPDWTPVRVSPEDESTVTAVDLNEK